MSSVAPQIVRYVSRVYGQRSTTACSHCLLNVGFHTSHFNGAKRTRTADPLNAIEVRYQLRYSPGLRIPSCLDKGEFVN